MKVEYRAMNVEYRVVHLSLNKIIEIKNAFYSVLTQA